MMRKIYGIGKIKNLVENMIFVKIILGSIF